MKRKIDEPLTSGALTGEHNDAKDERKELQAFILNRKKKLSVEKQLEIEFLAIRLRMDEYVSAENFQTYTVGDFIKECLNVAKIRQNKFAEYIGLKPSNLSNVLNGNRPLNYEFALILAKIFNISPMLWLEVQMKNELEKIIELKQTNLTNYSLDDLVG